MFEYVTSHTGAEAVLWLGMWEYPGIATLIIALGRPGGETSDNSCAARKYTPCVILKLLDSILF